MVSQKVTRKCASKVGVVRFECQRST